MHAPSTISRRISFGIVAFAAGCAVVVTESLAWHSSQASIAILGQGTVMNLVQMFYLGEILAIGLAAAGLYLVYRGIARLDPGPEPGSIKSFLAGALSSRKDLRLGAAAAMAYAAFYLIISSILVYQPSVDFRAAYGVTASGWNAAACCAGVGAVPSLVLWVAPDLHFAIQILPIDLLFAVVVPLLVCLNATVAAHGVRKKELRSSAGWVGSLGVLTSLFTGCPTCAGLFLASAAGGLGATTLALALAPYQVLFVLVSIPMLVLSPLLIAYSARRTVRAACAV